MNDPSKTEVPVVETLVETPSDPVATKLHELGVDPKAITAIKGSLGVENVEDLAQLTEDDLTNGSVGMKRIPARRLVLALASLRPSTTAESAASAVGAAVSLDGVLPSVPSDASWLEALRTGGVLKIDQSTVISAIRAALAYRAGLYDIPDGLVRLMERFADENDEQVDPEFFKLRKMLTRRSYAEIFEAIDGLDGSYVTDARKKQLFQRIDEHMWPAIFGFYAQLKSWQEAWLQGAANPALMMSAILSAGGMGPMPPGMMQPPDTGILRDTADAMNDSINKVFAGTGVQIASALAYDASRIKEILENPRLPQLTGAANRDQMLRQLGVAVSATYPRLETNLTRFVLSIMRVKDQSAGNEELQYFGALFMLGSQIPWGDLDDRRSIGKRPTGIGGKGGAIL